MADLKAKWKNKSKEELHCFCENIKSDREQTYFERYYKNGPSPWFREKKMDRDAFVSINRVGAGHPVLKQAEVD
jgi:hypothetical protein